MDESLLPDSNSPSDAQNKMMPPSDHMSLSSIEKWKKYHKFPFKLVLHLIMLLLTLLPFFLSHEESSSSTTSLRSYQMQHWAQKIFLHDESMQLRVLYTINDTIDTLLDIQHTYASLPYSSIAQVVSASDHHSNNTIQWSFNKTSYFTVENDREFINTTVATSLRSLQSLRLRLPVTMHEISSSFNITIEFRRSRNNPLALEAVVQKIDSSIKTKPKSYLSLGLIIAALLYLGLCVKSIYRSINLLRTAKKKASDRHLPLNVQIEFIRTRYILTAVGLVCIIINYGIYHIAFLNAIGTFLLWATSVGFLEKSPRYYSLILTIRWGLPRVMSFLVGALPVFVAYALAGTMYFTSTPCFASLNSSLKTLFAVMNGDEILDTFDSLSNGDSDSYYEGQLYLYSFITLFMYVVLNVFIAIIEEAFFATRACRNDTTVSPLYSTQEEFKNILETLDS